jgi:hypothetical protein
MWMRRVTPLRFFENNLYRVEMADTPPLTPTLTHLVIRRHDRLPCKSWAHFQRIKNELAGPECEAVELFPAESRLVDTANEYHLWVHAKPGFRFPIGWARRIVVQRPVASPMDVVATPGELNAAGGHAEVAASR